MWVTAGRPFLGQGLSGKTTGFHNPIYNDLMENPYTALMWSRYKEPLYSFQKPYEFLIETLYRSRIDPLCGARSLAESHRRTLWKLPIDPLYGALTDSLYRFLYKLYKSPI